MNLKLEEEEEKTKQEKPTKNISHHSETSSVEPPKEYELMLQKLEAEVRNHIRVEQQLKLQLETMQFKMEELENSNKKHIETTKKLSAVFFNCGTSIECRDPR